MFVYPSQKLCKIYQLCPRVWNKSYPTWKHKSGLSRTTSRRQSQTSPSTAIGTHLFISYCFLSTALLPPLMLFCLTFQPTERRYPNAVRERNQPCWYARTINQRISALHIHGISYRNTIRTLYLYDSSLAKLTCFFARY